MDIIGLIDKMLEGLGIEEKFVWDYLEDDQTTAYLIINDEKPNVFIITVELGKIEVIE